MKKWLIYVFSTGVCLWGCTLNEEWTEFTSPKDEVQDMKIELPKSSDDFGQAVADEIEVTVKKLVEMNVDYSDANGSKEFHDRFYNDFCQANPNLAKKRLRGETTLPTISPEQFAEGYASLTETQIKFVHKIIEECDRSTSDHDLLVRLISLRDEIYAEVPQIEQERLLNVISVLFYSIQELNHLAAQGMTLKTTNNTSSFPRLRNSSEGSGSHNTDEENGWFDEWLDNNNENKEDNDPDTGNVMAGCSSFLVPIWSIAVGEPTPGGEIVASVTTVVTLTGALLYHVVTCVRDYNDSHEEVNGSSELDFCYKKYIESMNGKNDWNDKHSGGWGFSECYNCWEQCKANGYWKCPVTK